MPKPQKNLQVYDFQSATFCPSFGEYSLEEALSNGAVVKVSSWVIPEMGFHPEGRRVHVVVTVRVWKTITTISPAVLKLQTVRGRGDDMLWLAAYALRKARKAGLDAAVFDTFLPTPDDEGTDAIKTLRVGWSEGDNRRWVTIGYPEEWAV